MDRTLIQSLGFNDPDKKEPDHDLVCQYLCQPHVAYKFAGLLPNEKALDDGRRPDAVTRNVVFGRARQEVVISKGVGQYRSHVGFIDCVIDFNWSEAEYPNGIIQSVCWQASTVAVEVKVLRASCSEIIRQLNLYREYVHGAFWAVATRFRLSQLEVESLRQHGVKSVFVGKGFDEWKEALVAMPCSGVAEL